MQSIKHIPGYKNAHWIMDEMELFYTEMSDDTKQGGLIQNVYDSSFKLLLDAFMKYGTKDFDGILFEDKPVERLQLKSYNPKNIIVCYSGGKDSLAVVQHYQKMGYNVYAYHIKGLNKTYYDEWKVAETAAKELGFNLIFDEVAYVGQHTWVEHPMKNMIMANMALTYGIQHDITTKIACGSFYTAHLSDIEFSVCGGDSADMWAIYDAIIGQAIPNFHMHIPNKSYETAYNLILKKPELLPLTISCLTPNRFRDLFRKRTINNYSADLLPNRCGCCWKCAAEYLWFCDHNVLQYNRQYYIHCLEILVNTMEQENGYRTYRLQTVWENYLFYPMTKSKAYEELKDAVILRNKIKVTSDFSS